jgi:hypothetical protein
MVTENVKITIEGFKSKTDTDVDADADNDDDDVNDIDNES